MDDMVFIWLPQKRRSFCSSTNAEDYWWLKARKSTTKKKPGAVQKGIHSLLNRKFEEK
jgi:hypothetical protein